MLMTDFSCNFDKRIQSDNNLNEGIYNAEIFKDVIPDLAKTLNVSKIVLYFKPNPEYSNTLLIRKCGICPDGNNVIYNSGIPCDENSQYSFDCFQADGIYTILFIKTKNEVQWNVLDYRMLKILGSSSINMLYKIRLIEISKSNEYYDYSTNILNNTGILYIIDHFINKNIANNYCCFYLNVRRFKLLNDKYNYGGGNVILKTLAMKLDDSLGENQYIGHLGSDNFLCIVKAENKQSVLDLLSNFYISYQNDTIQIDFYIGIYNMSNDDDVATTMNNTNMTFSLAKANPNNLYMEFTEDMHQKILEIKKIENIMRSALADNQFVTFFQPKVSLRDFKLVGAEALVRWNRDGSMIPPYKFVPIFEQNGFICEVDFCMLKNVCRSVKDWISKGIEPVTISVNFSKLHLTNHHFVQDVKNIIESYDIPPKYIEVEFTETLDVENYNSLVQINRELKRYGIKTSIDDFGAGFSSLSMLKDVPVDVLKLDKSLIDYTSCSVREKIIIQDIVKMAKSLDIEVIAEGVEDLEQLMFLKNIKCNQIQGYIFDKPLPLEEFEKRLIDNRYYNNNPKFKYLIKDKNEGNNDSNYTYGKFSVDINQDYKIIDFNEDFCNIIGYSKDELLNGYYTMEDFILKEDFYKYTQNIQHTIENSTEICEEYKMIKKNGSKIYVMSLGIYDGNSTITFMISDISLNKVTKRENEVLRSYVELFQKQIKEQEHFTEQVRMNIEGGVGLFALQNDNSLEVIYLSNSIYNIFSKYDIDKHKNDISKLLVPKHKDDFFNDINYCLNTNSTLIKDYIFTYDQKETFALTIKITSAKQSHNNLPLVKMIIVRSYDTNFKKKYIDTIENLTILSESSNMDIIKFNK